VLDTYYYPANSNKLVNVARGSTPMRIFSYDAAGNVIQDLRGANAYNYAVNNAGRIRQMSLNTGASVVANYTYDGFQKLRIKTSTSPAATTHYVWDSFGHIIAETSGAFTREYIWLGDTPLAINEGATLSYVHPDHLDRPVAMTTSGGQAVAWSAKYDPFGNVVTTTNPTAMPLRFPGQVFQIEDGLSYNWHRNYDPTLGRYSQADPLGFVDGPGVYNYAGGNPAMKVDPKGRMKVGPMSTPEKKLPNSCMPSNEPSELRPIPAGWYGNCEQAYDRCAQNIRASAACWDAYKICKQLKLDTIFPGGSVGRP
jgi:RHS repeat-associated protein